MPRPATGRGSPQADPRRQRPAGSEGEAKAAAEGRAARTKTFAGCVADFLQTQRLTQFKNDKHREAVALHPWQIAVQVVGDCPCNRSTPPSSWTAFKPVMLKARRKPAPGCAAASSVFSVGPPRIEPFHRRESSSRDLLKDALPAKPKAKHHKAMPYADLPAFMAGARATARSCQRGRSVRHPDRGAHREVIGASGPRST